ncbi:MAG: coenzyme F420 biosynthesis associated uncharacterized protein [Candidatus Poriferisodalaceae bacterium]|jgi:coenzyme F420 biosynthesis associated uncharacterized protein
MANPIDWELARRVARKVAGEEALSQSYLGSTLETDFARFTPEAEELVSIETGLVSADGPARARVIDRGGWIDANIASFRRLMSPLMGKLEEGPQNGLAASITGRAAALQLGSVLGWMSRRVLGQYDLLMVEDENPEDQDLVYYVGPNIMAIEKRFSFPPHEFRLWLALHELTHRAQFTGVPWLRPRFLGLVEELMGDLEPDPDQMKRGVKQFVELKKSGADPLADGGFAMLFASERQRELLDQVGGMMSLLEGHGDTTMSRAGRDRVTQCDHFHRVLHDRRQNSKGMTRLMQKVIGLEAKLAQYKLGEDFIEDLEADRGPRGVDRIWESVDNLPTMDEIKNPESWLTRVPAVEAATHPA